MNILIFEGIATSGKSTLITELQKRLTNFDVAIATEKETHIPIMQSRDELHIQFFTDLLDKLVVAHPELIIFDRLYLTQAFRAKAEISAYLQLENKLSEFNTITIFLKVEDTAIEERVQKAAEHRESEWLEYLNTRGANIHEIAQYYAQQQAEQLNNLKHSRLPYKIYDTPAHNYKSIAKDIVSTLRSSQ